MTKQQRQIVRDYISLSHRRVSTHLRSLGLLNNNRTLPRSEGAQINLERWFFDTINSAHYTLSVTDAGVVDHYFHPGGVEVTLEVGPFDSCTGNPVIFEFDAAAWPSLFEDAVSVDIDDGVVRRPDVFIEPSLLVNVCGDILAESYKTLFVDGNLGSIADLPGMEETTSRPTALQNLVSTLIDAEQNNMLTAVLEYACALVDTDKNGEITPASKAAVTDWLNRNGLMKSLQRIVQSGVVA